MNSLFSTILLHADPAAAPADGGSGSLLKFITGGGIIGYIIVVLSVVAVAFVVIHFVQIRRNALVPAERVKGVRELVERGDLEGALEYATLPVGPVAVIVTARSPVVTPQAWVCCTASSSPPGPTSPATRPQPLVPDGPTTIRGPVIVSLFVTRTSRT